MSDVMALHRAYLSAEAGQSVAARDLADAFLRDDKHLLRDLLARYRTRKDETATALAAWNDARRLAPVRVEEPD